LYSILAGANYCPLILLYYVSHLYIAIHIREFIDNKGAFVIKALENKGAKSLILKLELKLHQNHQND